MNKKALIFWGGWQGHTPERSANVVRDILSDNGFDVQIEQGTSALANLAIGDFNLIVPVVTMSTIEKPELDNPKRHRVRWLSWHHVRQFPK
ncbi:hypothetical protein GGD55_003716 [Rhizobium giardinii]|uniref:Flavodoxin-like domain-containing protein n=1 Tax=Rhizobium giardinii TaxID=56731 RepID=A0A7W8UCS7_9HYPH|nr:hypothetical protein [Rhizobium giardinii]